MCGIIGYIGDRQAVSIIIEGLRKLEYRGYDSAGLAVIGDDGSLQVRRALGKLRHLEDTLQHPHPLTGRVGIGHTRWATHGRPSEENAHPHVGPEKRVAVVHNGIIENYATLRQELEQAGHQFATETDTEVIAHLIEKHLTGTLEEATQVALSVLRGHFVIAVVSSADPEKIVVARQGPPAVVGLGKDAYFIASDATPLLSHTRDMFFLADGDMAVLTRDGVQLTNFQGVPVSREVTRVQWDPIMAEKGGFKHFMLKEIFEQPRAVRETFITRIGQESGRVYLEEISFDAAQLASVSNIKIVACGTSWHAATAGKFMIEQLARVPVEVDYASEFRYRDPLIQPNTLVIFVSQSGETADTLAALAEAKGRGALTLAVCNVPGSTLAREATGCLLTHAGPEIAVASTKAFTAQLTAIFLFALYLAQSRKTLSQEESLRLVDELVHLPGKLEAALTLDDQLDNLAKLLYRSNDFLYLGRGIHYPIAMEGALKLKEVSYIHAEGYPAGEMKHGPNALIDDGLPVMFLATRDDRSSSSRRNYEKTLSAIHEVRARDGILIAVANEGDTKVSELCPHTFFIPQADELLLPILEVLPLQFLAYYIALRRGCDVDQPRNLAKSVTVE
jgi:glucosamine--fructose-6-phosphate aminotransferase (isomerizing)